MAAELGLLAATAAVGFYGATAQEKRNFGPSAAAVGLQQSLDAAVKRANEEAAKAAKLANDLKELQTKCGELQKKSGSAMAAEDAFRRASPDVLKAAADCVIKKLNIVDERMKSVLQAPAKSTLRRGTLWQLYGLASQVEGAPPQKGGRDPPPLDDGSEDPVAEGTADLDEKMAAAAGTPPPPPPPPPPPGPQPEDEKKRIQDEALAPEDVADEIADVPMADPEVAPPPAPAASDYEEGPPSPTPEAPEVVPAPAPAPALTSLFATPPTSIRSMGYDAFAAAWVECIDAGKTALPAVREEQRVQTKNQEDAIAAEMSNDLLGSAKAVVADAEGQMPELDIRAGTLTGTSQANAQMAKKKLEDILSLARDIAGSTPSTTAEQWQGLPPEWKTIKRDVTNALAAYRTAVSRPRSLSERLGLSKPAPSPALFTGTAMTPAPVVVPAVVPAPALAPAVVPAPVPAPAPALPAVAIPPPDLPATPDAVEPEDGPASLDDTVMAPDAIAGPPAPAPEPAARPLPDNVARTRNEFAVEYAATDLSDEDKADVVGRFYRLDIDTQESIQGIVRQLATDEERVAYLRKWLEEQRAGDGVVAPARPLVGPRPVLGGPNTTRRAPTDYAAKLREWQMSRLALFNALPPAQKAKVLRGMRRRATRRKARDDRLKRLPGYVRRGTLAPTAAVPAAIAAGPPLSPEDQAELNRIIEDIDTPSSPAPASTSLADVEAELEDEIAGALTPEEIAATVSAVNRPLGPQVDVDGEMAALGTPTAAVPAPVPGSPPGPPLARTLARSTLERSFDVADNAKTKDELKSAIDVIEKEMAAHSGVVTTQTKYRNRLTALRETLKTMKGGRRVRKSTLRTHRGVNKRKNVRGSRGR
jgi:hypothetical protein